MTIFKNKERLEAKGFTTVDINQQDTFTMGGRYKGKTQIFMVKGDEDEIVSMGSNGGKLEKILYRKKGEGNQFFGSLEELEAEV